MRNINQENTLNDFAERVGTEYLAQAIRRFVHEAIQMSFEADQDNIKREWISSGYYFLTEISEILDPQMKKE